MNTMNCFWFNYIAILLASVVVHGNVLDSTSRINGRIIGGENADIKDYPYQVTLQRKNLSHFCGGSIISPNVILTAGHCTNGSDINAFQIRAGSSDRTKGGVIRQIAKIIVHEKYDIFDYDISLLILTEPLEYSDTIQPIQLPEESEVPKANEMGTITGWGLNGQLVQPKILQKLNIPIVDESTCIEILENHITPRILCAGFLGVSNKNACSSDSGGPLAIKGKLQGITSFGALKCGSEQPVAYVRVTYFRSWIREQVNI